MRDEQHLRELEAELERAVVVHATELIPDVITMHTRAQVLDVEAGERGEYVVVFPSEADVWAGRISVLAPLGTALLGYREGDEVQWMMPGRLRRLRIERVSQPVDEAPAQASAL